uniref:Uncharacterized protein n=1 Tax=Arundo donax TaxID=35708 RepID=A0A0A8ZQ31_ARUDO
MHWRLRGYEKGATTTFSPENRTAPSSSP